MENSGSKQFQRKQSACTRAPVPFVGSPRLGGAPVRNATCSWKTAFSGTQHPGGKLFLSKLFSLFVRAQQAYRSGHREPLPRGHASGGLGVPWRGTPSHLAALGRSTRLPPARKMRLPPTVPASLPAAPADAARLQLVPPLCCCLLFALTLAVTCCSW